jgi:transcriptional regulator with XRE-family HTH domain
MDIKMNKEAIADDVPDIGKNILTLRKRINLSLDGLSDMCGVSKAMLSKVEQGKVNPTLAVLWKIARGLGVDFSTLLGTNEGERIFSVYKKGFGISIQNPDKTVTLNALTPPQMVDELEMYWIDLKPNGVLNSEAHFSFTEEFVTVISGEVEISAGDRIVQLQKGDSVRYSADVKHTISELSGKGSELHMTVYFKTVEQK